MAGLLRSSAARCALRRVSSTVARRRFAAVAAVWEDDDLDYWTDCEEKAHVPLAEDTCSEMGPRGVQWVFMGSPGVHKHLYAARMAQLLRVPYISMGTLVRQELHPTSSIYLKFDHWGLREKIETSVAAMFAEYEGYFGKSARCFRVAFPLVARIANSVNEGRLVPEEIIFGLLSKRLEDRFYRGESGFILDGIPRTRLQAEMLDQMVDIDLVVNFKSKDETIFRKQIRGDIETCTHCGGPFNRSEPESSRSNPCLVTRTRHAHVHSNAVVGLEGSRLEKIHLRREQSKILEDYYRGQRKLVNFQVSGGHGETWKGLLAALQLQHIDASSSPQKLTV